MLSAPDSNINSFERAILLPRNLLYFGLKDKKFQLHLIDGRLNHIAYFGYMYIMIRTNSEVLIRWF